MRTHTTATATWARPTSVISMIVRRASSGEVYRTISPFFSMLLSMTATRNRADVHLPREVPGEDDSVRPLKIQKHEADAPLRFVHCSEREKAAADEPNPLPFPPPRKISRISFSGAVELYAILWYNSNSDKKRRIGR